MISQTLKMSWRKSLGQLFDQARVIPLNLESEEAEAVRRIAEARGTADAELSVRAIRHRRRE
jgi:hypothetical protein